MDKGGSTSTPWTVDRVFRDFMGRRAGLIKALTTDYQDLRQQCGPDKDDLCLYGHSDGTWELKKPSEYVPTPLPEPALGFNLVRDRMEEKNWRKLIAIHSDAWILSVAFSLGALDGFDMETRMHLFSKINSLPMIHEVVCGTAKKQAKETVPGDSGRGESSSKQQHSRPTTKPYVLPSRKRLMREPLTKHSASPPIMEEDEGNKSCGACGNKVSDDEPRVRCDECDRWYHCACLRLSQPSQIRRLGCYKCPRCCHSRR